MDFRRFQCSCFATELHQVVFLRALVCFADYESLIIPVGVLVMILIGVPIQMELNQTEARRELLQRRNGDYPYYMEPHVAVLRCLKLEYTVGSLWTAIQGNTTPTSTLHHEPAQEEHLSLPHLGISEDVPLLVSNMDEHQPLL